MSLRDLAVKTAFLLAVASLHLNASNAADSKCVEYGPTIVTLSGTITRHLAYGPPNYGEDPAHDAKEVYWYLQLENPICVNGKQQHSGERSEDIVGENDVRMIQIVYMEGYPNGDRWINHRASITGTLFHAITGHHHTKILINAIDTAAAT